MPDWRELVRQRLSGLSLDLGEKEEVCKELAGHLEKRTNASEKRAWAKRTRCNEPWRK
jgi:hypothetical protein